MLLHVAHIPDLTARYLGLLRMQERAIGPLPALSLPPVLALYDEFRCGAIRIFGLMVCLLPPSVEIAIVVIIVTTKLTPPLAFFVLVDATRLGLLCLDVRLLLLLLHLLKHLLHERRWHLHERWGCKL